MTQLVYVFDLDDTLISERDYVFSGFRAVGDFVQKQYGLIGFEELATSFFCQGMRGYIFNEVLKTLGLDDTEDVICELVNVYRNHLPDISLLDDARKCLDHLKKMKMPMALITDGHAISQHKKIEATKLANWIQCIVVTDDWGKNAWKPSPDAYRRVMEYFHDVSDRFIYIGDNPAKDFISPKQLGWSTARVLRPGSEHEKTAPRSSSHAAAIEMRSLTELFQAGK